MIEEFYLGQIFEGEYPPEAAIWCILNQYEIVAAENEDGQKSYEIKEPTFKSPEAEALKIANLSLTAADVERAIYKAFNKDFDDIIEMIAELAPKGLDLKALKIELKANNFYRGNPYISQVGALLGITELQLDEFFETNDYTKLLIKEEEE